MERRSGDRDNPHQFDAGLRGEMAHLTARPPRGRTDVTLESLNWLDWLVLFGLGVSAIDGMRRGFVLGTFDLVAAALALVGAFVAERPVADLLVHLVPGFAPALAHVAAFLGLLLVSQML